MKNLIKHFQVPFRGNIDERLMRNICESQMRNFTIDFEFKLERCSGCWNMSDDTDGGTYFVSRFELTKDNTDFTSYIIHDAASKGHYMPIYISSFDSDFAYNVKDIGNDITSETITDDLPLMRHMFLL